VPPGVAPGGGLFAGDGGHGHGWVSLGGGHDGEDENEDD
jgi:hypothetical protein